MGYILFISLLITIYSYFLNNNFYIFAGLLLLIYTGLSIQKLIQNIMITILSTITLLTLFINIYWEFDLDYVKLLTINQNLIALLIAVSLLKLITVPKIESTNLYPSGKNSFFKTYFSVHIFGSVINLSALLLTADKMFKRSPLSDLQIMTLTRAFASDAYWSPFFVAFAAASTYAPNLNSLTILLSGVFLAIVSFSITYIELKRENLDNFYGYPLSLNSLVIPTFLAISVLSIHYYFPNYKVILLVSLFCCILVFLILPLKFGLTNGFKRLKNFIVSDLANMKMEVSLFLIAGMFGVSISTMLIGLDIHFSFDNFNWISASTILFIFICLSFIGIHPIISIAILSEFISELNHTLLAIAFLMSWATTVSTSPFSGLNIALKGRYNINPIDTFKNNISFSGKMFLVYIPLLYLIDTYWSR